MSDRMLNPFDLPANQSPEVKSEDLKPGMLVEFRTLQSSKIYVGRVQKVAEAKVELLVQSEFSSAAGVFTVKLEQIVRIVK